MTFDGWLASLHFGEPDAGGQVGTPVPGAMDFLREVYAHNGPIEIDALHSAQQSRQVELATKAVVPVLADIRRTTDLCPHIEVRTLDSGATAIAFNGSYTTEPMALRTPEIIRDVADNLRDQVVDELWTVWPVCPSDGLGLDPRVVDGEAVWHCRVRDHVAARIGELRPSKRNAAPTAPRGGRPARPRL